MNESILTSELRVERTRTKNLQIDLLNKPFLKWAGGKTQLIPEILKYSPTKFNKYIEPFIGGGALFFNLRHEKSIIADLNEELIISYERVKNNVHEVISILETYNNNEEFFYKIRGTKPSTLSECERAARLIYLNKTCFNGLYRVNQQGQFNVPIGSSLNRLICDEHTIRSASKILKNITIQESDFETSVRNAKSGDFIYLDPPYYPISINSDFTRYTKEKFYQEDQIRLKKEIDRLSKIGCKIMLSNSDCDFIKNLYKEYKIRKVYSGRTLNCKKDQRGKRLI